MLEILNHGSYVFDGNRPRTAYFLLDDYAVVDYELAGSIGSFLVVGKRRLSGSLALEAPGRREMSGATKEIGAPEYRIGKFQWNFVLTPRGIMISDPVLGPVVIARK